MGKIRASKAIESQYEDAVKMAELFEELVDISTSRDLDLIHLMSKMCKSYVKEHPEGSEKAIHLLDIFSRSITHLCSHYELILDKSNYYNLLRDALDMEMRNYYPSEGPMID